MTHPASLIGVGGYAVGNHSIQIRKIDNGWIVSYWAARSVERFCKTEEIGPLVATSALDLEKFINGLDLPPGMAPLAP